MARIARVCAVTLNCAFAFFLFPDFLFSRYFPITRHASPHKSSPPSRGPAAAMVNPAAAARRALPSLDRLLGSAAVTALIAAHGRSRVTETLRRALDAERERLAQPDAA